MIRGKSCIGETHYDILSSREDATHDEIRASYRSAVLNAHPDKLQNPETSCENGPGDRFFKVQKAWEVLGDSKSRALYDNELRASRRDDVAAAEDLGLEDMEVEDRGEIVELYYECRCGDCFCVDSFELGKMGYSLLRNNDENKVSLKTVDGLPASVLLPCGSCSLKVRLLIDPNICVSVGGGL